MSIETHSSAQSNILVDILKFTIIAFLIVTPFRFFIAQPFIVSGSSMAPTFDPKEYLVIDEVSYRFHEPQRGDVVIFKYPLDPSIFFIKRIIGLPGETIEITEGVVTVHTSHGEVITTLSEPYLPPKSHKKDSSKTELEEGEYFVMGDNRDASSDSRVWGPLQKKFIVGRAFARLLPVSELGLFPGKFSFDTEQK